jgi:hypothetical protein
MVTKKSPPTPASRFTALIMYFATVGLSNFKAELQQLAVNARRAPKRVINAHSRISARRPSRSAGALRSSATSSARSETRPVRSNQRLGTDDWESLQYRRKQAIKLDEGSPVRVANRTLPRLSRTKTSTCCRSAVFSAEGAPSIRMATPRARERTREARSSHQLTRFAQPLNRMRFSVQTREDLGVRIPAAYVFGS